MTPIGQTRTQEEVRYNSAHVRTRATIECTFGRMKMRFRCMDGSGGVILSQPELACDMIFAVAALHNIAERRNLPILNDEYVVPYNPVEQPDIVRVNEGAHAQGADIRRNLVQTFAHEQ